MITGVEFMGDLLLHGHFYCVKLKETFCRVNRIYLEEVCKCNFIKL